MDKITIEYGFLQLHIARGGLCSVKGSAIISVTSIDSIGNKMSLEMDAHSAILVSGSVTPFFVVEKREQILNAVAESYVQAARR